MELWEYQTRQKLWFFVNLNTKRCTCPSRILHIDLICKHARATELYLVKNYPNVPQIIHNLEEEESEEEDLEEEGEVEEIEKNGRRTGRPRLQKARKADRKRKNPRKRFLHCTGGGNNNSYQDKQKKKR